VESPQHLLHPSVDAHFFEEHKRHHAERSTSRFARHNKWLPMAAIGPAMLISTLDMTTLNVALPDLTDSINATTSELQWIVDAYTIVLAGFLVFAQGIGDRLGRKGTFMTGLAILMCASAAASFTQSPPPLIAVRAMMGVGAALMMSPTLAMIAVIYKAEDRPKAVAIWVALGSLGISLGPIIGGFLVDAFGWQATFLVNVPVITVTLVLSAMWLPSSRKPGVMKLDFIGMLLSIVGLSILLFGLIEGPTAGWISTQTLGAIGLGLLMTVGFVVWELRNPNPMFDPRVLRVGGVQAGAGTLFADYIAFLGMLFLVPQYLQFVEGYSAAVTGLIMLPFGVMVAFGAQSATKVTQKMGREAIVIGGMCALALGFVILCFMAASLWVVLLGMLVLGVGFGFTIGPGTAMVVNSLPVSKAGDGSSVNMLMRQVGGAFGVALIGSVFASVYTSKVVPALAHLDRTAAADVARSVQGALEAAKLLGNPAAERIIEAADGAFLSGARAGMLVAAAVTLISAGITVTARRRKSYEMPEGIVEAAEVARNGETDHPGGGRGLA
jgi:EmrB/QacA subfamily drug resistance transporter